MAACLFYAVILQSHSNELLKPWEMPIRYPATLQIGMAQSVIVEIGPGRGDFLYHLAYTNPQSLVVAIEIKRKRIDRLVHRLQKRGITNVLLIQSDARAAIPKFFKDNSVSEIHINFPDPWPKKRHAKNRLMTENFLRDCLRKLKASGALHFATDQEWYAQEVLETASRLHELENKIEQEPDGAFPTLFMQKWRDRGKSLYYQKYMKSLTP